MSNRHVLRRRDFLASGSLCAVSPLLAPAAARGNAGPEALDAGYVAGSEKTGATGGPVVSAVHVEGDPTLARTGIEISITGFSAPPEMLARRELRSFAVDVGSPSVGVNVRLWRFDDDGMFHVSSDVSLRAPAHAGLDVFLDLSQPVSRISQLAGSALFGPSGAEPLRRTRLSTHLASKGNGPHAGLRCGTYILAGPSRHSGQPPRWRGRHAHLDASGAPTLTAQPDFPYVALTVRRTASDSGAGGHVA